MSPYGRRCGCRKGSAQLPFAVPFDETAATVIVPPDGATNAAADTEAALEAATVATITSAR